VTSWTENNCSNALKNGVHVLYGLRQIGKSLITDFNNLVFEEADTGA
jgi:hypothetical protein